jgi:hypothetical protein
MIYLRSKINLLLLSAIFNSVLCLAQDKNTLNWPDGKLTWEDYQAKPDSPNSFLSYIDFAYDADMQGNGKVLDVKVSCFFNRSKSYMGDAIKNNELLEREQLHFDITEKYARLFRKELQDQKWESKTCRKDFDRLYKKLANENKAEQKLCDLETKKGKHPEKTAEWKSKVAKEIKKLDKYSTAIFTIKVKA